MSKIKISFILTTLIVFLFCGLPTNLAGRQSDSVTEAIQLFDKGKFSEAEIIFKKLLDLQPEHYMLNYYYGACRTETGNFTEDDLNCLLKASKKVSLPALYYYLGIQQHARNNWETALDYYTRFKLNASFLEQTKKEILLKIAQCNNRENPYPYTPESQIANANKLNNFPELSLNQNSNKDQIKPTQDNLNAQNLLKSRIKEMYHPVEEPEPEIKKIDRPAERQKAKQTKPVIQPKKPQPDNRIPEEKEIIPITRTEPRISDKANKKNTKVKNAELSYIEPSEEKPMVLSIEKIPNEKTAPTPKAIIDDEFKLIKTDTLLSEKTDFPGIEVKTEEESEQINPGLSVPGEKEEDEVEADTNTIINVVTEIEPEIQSIADTEPIEFQINENFIYLSTFHFKTEEGKSLYEMGILKQKQLEKNIETTEELRANYLKQTSAPEKQAIGDKIILLENETYKLKYEASKALLDAKNIENEYWQNASPEEKEAFKIKLSNYDTFTGSGEITPAAANTDNTEYINPKFLLNSDLDRNKSTKKANNNLRYKIQIGAFSRGMPNSFKKLYNKLSVIRTIDSYTDENGIVVYTTGNLSNLEDAVTMQKQIIQEGVKDALVAPYFKGKRITLEQAKEIVNKR